MGKAAEIMAELSYAEKKHESRHYGTVTSLAGTGVYVLLDGADEPTLCSTKDVHAFVGNRVEVEIRDHRATVKANPSRPVTDDATAISAQASADSAYGSAQQAAGAAANAATAAATAEGHAQQAISDAAIAKGAADAAQEDATAAATAAASAQDSASQALLDAAAAATAAGAAQTSATNAATAAASAQTSADTALGAANKSLVQLSIVEDVAGTLSWISEHGTYTATTDTTVQEGTVYFELVDDDYVPIASPDTTKNPHTEGWYVLDVTDSQTDYIMAHIAVTNAGLWVLPAGLGTAQTEQAAPGYKVLLSNSGMTVYDGSGNAIATYGGSGISFAEDKSFYIGDQSAYVFFDGNGHITIGGAVTLGSTKTLSELLGEVEQASEDAAAAKDICSISITSTGGTVFKQNRGVSTTLIVTVFTGDGLRITTASALHDRFGPSAYLQWKWKDSPTDSFTTLVSDDSRIGAGGFTLTVSPSDISTQAIIDCELIF